MAAVSERRKSESELVARIAEVEAEAARRLAVSTKAWVRPETRDYSVPCLTGIVEAMSYRLQAVRRSTCEDSIRHALDMLVSCAMQTDRATPLYIASQKGHAECVRALLDRGAAINQAEVGCTSSTARRRVGLSVWGCVGACLHACMRL